MDFEKPKNEKGGLVKEADRLEKLFNELDHQLGQFHLAKAIDSMDSEESIRSSNEDRAKIEKEKESVRKQLSEIYRRIGSL